MGKQVSETDKKADKKVVVITVISVLIIAALVAVIIFLVTNKPVQESEPEVRETSDGRGVVLTPENIDTAFEKKVEKGYFESCMSNEWTFVNGLSDMESVYVKNAETNNNAFYFDLIVDEGEKLVYSSPYIPVGAELPQFKLTESLSAGDYKGTVKYHLVDGKNEEVSDVSIAVTLHIK